MKKLLGIVMLTLSIGLIGCGDTNTEVTTIDKPEIKEEVEIKEEPEEKIENTVLTMEDETFKHYMTSNLSDDEYVKYFDTIEAREIEFDGCIIEANLKEGYDTIFEMLMATGDYNENEINGPYIKVYEIMGMKLDGMAFGKCNVKVKATLEGYDKEKGYLVIRINEIERR